MICSFNFHWTNGRVNTNNNVKSNISLNILDGQRWRKKKNESKWKWYKNIFHWNKSHDHFHCAGNVTLWIDNIKSLADNSDCQFTFLMHNWLSIRSMNIEVAVKINWRMEHDTSVEWESFQSPESADYRKEFSFSTHKDEMIVRTFCLNKNSTIICKLNDTFRKWNFVVRENANDFCLRQTWIAN